MRAPSKLRVFAAAMLLASGIGAACATFSGDGGGHPETDAAGDDGSSLEDSSIGDSSLEDSSDGDSSRVRGPDANVPAVAGFSKLAGGLTLDRPPNTQIGDLLVLIAAETESGPADWSAFSTAVKTSPHCPNLNKDYLQYATRVDDGTASYAVGDAGATTNVDAVLLAVRNAGSPDDYALSDQAGTNTGSAAAVTVMHEIDLVLAAFASSSAVTRRPPDGGLAVVTEGAIDVYQGLFPLGRTSTFGPFAEGTPCWGTLTVAIPPH